MNERNIPYNQLKKAEYNRPINRSHVNEIKRDFDEALVQPAIVSFRDGKYWIIDHQHLSQAIYELNGSDPNTPIRCDVRTGLSYEQEAKLYYKLNTSSKALNFNDELTGLLEAGDETALAFRDAVESCGYVVKTRNSTNALNAVKRAWNYFDGGAGRERLVDALSLARACWPSNGMNAKMLDGIVMFLDNHGDDYNRSHFVKNFSRLSMEEEVRKGVGHYKLMNSREYTYQYCMYVVLVADYNKNLKTNRITQVLPKN